MASWDNYWLDISSESCLPYIKEMVVGRLEKFKEYGVDGVDPDNVDAVSLIQDEGYVDLC